MGFISGLGDFLFGPAKDVVKAAGAEDQSAIDKRNRLNEAAGQAGDFANYGQGGFMSLGTAADKARQNLADIASGKISYSGEQLRQGLQQNLATQRSLAASAAPGNAAMAARTAAIQGARLGAGVSGASAMAGIAERESAAKALQDAILQQRQQELQAALQSRGNQIQAYTGVTPDKSWIEKYGPAIQGGLGTIGKFA